MIFQKNLARQIKDILDVAEEKEIKTLIKYKRDGFTILLSNNEQDLNELSLKEDTIIKTRGRKKKEEA